MLILRRGVWGFPTASPFLLEGYSADCRVRRQEVGRGGEKQTYNKHLDLRTNLSNAGYKEDRLENGIGHWPLRAHLLF